MTLDEIFALVEDAPPDERQETADRLLAKYDGFDKADAVRQMPEFIMALDDRPVYINGVG
jgi:hypothetical protein